MAWSLVGGFGAQKRTADGVFQFLMHHNLLPYTAQSPILQEPAEEDLAGAAAELAASYLAVLTTRCIRLSQ